MRLDSSFAAVVTGGASGLDEAAARAPAETGVKVALFDRNAELGLVVAEKIWSLFCDVVVTADASVATGFVAARKAHGQERVLVNCAGIVADANRQLPLHRPLRARHGRAGSARWRVWRHRQHRLDRGSGRENRPSRLQRVRGRDRRAGADGGARPRGRRHPGKHYSTRHH